MLEAEAKVEGINLLYGGRFEQKFDRDGCPGRRRLKWSDHVQPCRNVGVRLTGNQGHPCASAIVALRDPVTAGSQSSQPAALDLSQVSLNPGAECRIAFRTIRLRPFHPGE